MTFDRAFLTEDPPHAAIPEPTRWNVLELYDAEHLIPPEGFFLEHLVCRKDVALIAGRRGTGKTYLTLQLAASIAAGTNLGHMATRIGRVLYISQEMADDRVRRRIRALLTRDQAAQIADHLTLVCRKPGLALDEQQGANKLQALITDTGPDIVVVDALRYVKGRARENNNDEMGEVMLRLLDVAHHANIAMILIHHMGKPKEDGFESGRGASVIEDLCADVMYLTKDREHAERRLVRFDKTRDSDLKEPFTFELLSTEGDEHKVELLIRPGEDTGQQEDFELRRGVEWIRSHGGEAATIAVRDAMSWTERTARRYLSRAKNLNLLVDHKVGTKKMWCIPDENQGDVPF